MKKTIVLLASHIGALLIGFGAGIYFLPILTAPEPPDVSELQAAANGTEYTANFRRDLRGSDRLHWGDGKVFVGRNSISLQGTIAPGPDYKLYLSPSFVETEAEFARLKANMVRVGDVVTFENFIVPVSQPVDLEAFNTVIVWCETFGQLITAAQYR